MSYAAIEEEGSSFITIRRQYFDITNDYCAAKLIEYFKCWTEWKMDVHRTPWVYQPLERIHYDLIGEHSLHAIRRAIRLLEEMGLLERRHNPSNGQDKTWQYKLNLDRLNELLKHRKLRNEGRSYNGEQYHRSYINSDPYNNVAVEEEEMLEDRWEELAKEVERWEKAIQQQEMERISAPEQLITHEDQLSRAALKDAEIESILVQCDEIDAGLEIGSQSQTAIASPNFAQEEEERIPRVIVTSYVPGAIAISSVPQVQKPQEQSGSGLGAIHQQEAIAPANSTQQELETVSQAVVSPKIEGAIASKNVPQKEAVTVPKSQLSKGIELPSPANSVPVIPKKLTQTELDAIEDELKRLRINPDSCISVIKKYWENVSGAIARVKEALQQGWCSNPTGLFINSCKKGIKPQKTQVSNDVSEWFNWARKQRIVIAMTGGTAYTPEGEPVSIREMMELHPMRT